MNSIESRIHLAKAMYTACYNHIGGRGANGFTFETADEYFNNKANAAEIDKWIIAAGKYGNEFLQVINQTGKAEFKQAVPEDFDLAYLRDIYLRYIA